MAKADKDNERDKPIRFLDEFRDAKRNVLLAGTITILLALGATSTEAVEVAGLIKGLSFRPGVLLVGSMIALAFLLLSYIRADRRLVANHTPFMVERDLEHTETIAKHVQGRLAELERQAGEAEHISKHLVEVAQQRIENFDQWFAAQPMIVDGDINQSDVMTAMTFLSRIEANATPGSDRFRPEADFRAACDMIARKLTEAIQGRVRAKKQQMLTNASSHAKLADDQGKSALPQSIASLQSISAELAATRAELHGFSRRIGRGDKAWFYLLDRAVVAIMTVAAFTAAIVRIESPVELDKSVCVAMNTIGVEQDRPCGDISSKKDATSHQGLPPASQPSSSSSSTG